jgi:hypothetical protein
MGIVSTGMRRIQDAMTNLERGTSRAKQMRIAPANIMSKVLGKQEDN